MPIDNIETLKREFAAGRKTELLLFWGHTAKGDEVGEHVLSQWWPAPFSLDGLTYPTAEHYMMAQKAALFGDQATRDAILAAPGPSQAKKLGREVRGFDDARWIAHRFDIAVRGNVAKFGQNPLLADWLRTTAEAVLVEASPVDRIWGIGLAADDPRARDPLAWRGLNLLGFALMVARAQLG
ncbi:NADAR family protein [Bradyrhizobium sp. HKCCYLS20291]|uniref:NADAR family protein n=1 Tax=Bradyrhizobium sp. HKCCYLS20291 TaxID=3420766 RepID=UPI003EBE3D8B